MSWVLEVIKRMWPQGTRGWEIGTPQPSPCSWKVCLAPFLTLEAASRSRPWANVLWGPQGWYTGLDPSRLLYKRLRLGRQVWRPIRFCYRPDQVPLLLQMDTSDLAWSASFSGISFRSAQGPVCKLTTGFWSKSMCLGACRPHPKTLTLDLRRGILSISPWPWMSSEGSCETVGRCHKKSLCEVVPRAMKLFAERPRSLPNPASS